jgi:hypothetical protein
MDPAKLRLDLLPPQNRDVELLDVPLDRVKARHAELMAMGLPDEPEIRVYANASVKVDDNNEARRHGHGIPLSPGDLYDLYVTDNQALLEKADVLAERYKFKPVTDSFFNEYVSKAENAKGAVFAGISLVEVRNV